MHYQRVPVAERLPEENKFVPTIDEAGELMVYRLTEHGWNMRDSPGNNSPDNNLPIVYWLEEVDLIDQEEKAQKWDDLGELIGRCYVDEKGEELSEEASENIDLTTIGELAATAFGWL